MDQISTTLKKTNTVYSVFINRFPNMVTAIRTTVQYTGYSWASFNSFVLLIQCSPPTHPFPSSVYTLQNFVNKCHKKEHNTGNTWPLAGTGQKLLSLPDTGLPTMHTWIAFKQLNYVQPVLMLMSKIPTLNFQTGPKSFWDHRTAPFELINMISTTDTLYF
jgi:hypothetical protein